MDGVFKDASDLEQSPFGFLFKHIPSSVFRFDISSTEIRYVKTLLLLFKFSISEYKYTELQVGKVLDNKNCGIAIYYLHMHEVESHYIICNQ